MCTLTLSPDSVSEMLHTCGAQVGTHTCRHLMNRSVGSSCHYCAQREYYCTLFQRSIQLHAQFKHQLLTMHTNSSQPSLYGTEREQTLHGLQHQPFPRTPTPYQLPMQSRMPYACSMHHIPCSAITRVTRKVAYRSLARVTSSCSLLTHQWPRQRV